ncbi:hypothetical protein [Nonomuraea insulae]|uniref:5-bromo-4-chloroindolyl phosphate hydrolysis protein n=1 Tax=Nonomuraea insulae TaxID=1616787 RepID=A0ABW1DFI8_9ACTN
METWTDQPIMDPDIPLGDRRRIISAASLLLGRPDHEPPRWVRRLFAGAAICTAALGGALSAAAYETGHESAGLAALMVFFTAILFIGVSRPNAGVRLSREYAGRYIFPAELDDPALDLVTRARRAIKEVSASRVHRLGLLDGIANDVVLPRRLWDVARLVRIQADLRAEQAEARAEVMTPELAAVLEPQQEALRRSVAAVTERVWELEMYAGRVRSADSALRASELQRSNDKYLDLLAQTGDTEGLRALTDQADALTASLREAIAAGQTLGT